ncbi:EamA family transporter [Rosenbergiella sp. S61]|uniref:EamA family transporter n=1 Tax=Rosenbergiella gaditana TaxID=2726987 RepID=A0ABS5SWZ0_9GAMM|nr:EamA family transporter [Rosenbergiella gaditana]MBT0723283.1 EamA family transporter [Rosenbergiella gaditana]
MKPTALGNSCVVMAALLWGTTGTAARLAPQLSPITIACVAMGVGGILQALLALPAIVGSLSQLKQHRYLLIFGACAVAIYPLAFYCSMDFAGVAIGTVISIGSAPLFSALIENRLEGSALSKQWLCGALVGVIGISLLAQLHTDSSTDSGPPSHALLLGVALGLVAGLTYALYSWTARRMMVKGIMSRAAMGSTFGVGGILLLPLLILTGAPLLDSWRNAAVGSYMAIFPMCVGYLCYGAGLARIKASVATAITLLEPVVAALLAVSILGETLSPLGWLGIGLIVSSLVITAWPTRSTASK